MLETVSIICLAQFSRLLLGMGHCEDIGRAVTKHEMRCANCFLICTFCLFTLCTKLRSKNRRSAWPKFSSFPENYKSEGVGSLVNATAIHPRILQTTQGWNTFISLIFNFTPHLDADRALPKLWKRHWSLDCEFWKSAKNKRSLSFDSEETPRSKNRQLSDDHYCEPQWGADKRQTRRPFIPQ